ncbi:hypothetical protein EDD36DRAFT_469459 [Exophiala viscosa]|uniref:DNA (cytosine-5-)-methyltransferase n=1 Tax=Exophiala viscosa TaxID=2486360 RepID=A0AAN6DL17_9EURO|nr:hypothetical protein EDD36DRAFT_469459 [Exophiala viscosa]
MEVYSGEDVSNHHEVEDIPECLRPERINLGLSPKYCRWWTPKDAFREFYQNLKDGIIASFDIEPSDFRADVSESTGLIAITFRARTGLQPLGFIKFNRTTGTLLMSNFKAKLLRRHLIIGESDKGDNKAFAGCHGEGFKLGALVMSRAKYSLEIDSSSHYLKFGFCGRGRHESLRCNITAAGVKGVEREKAAFTRRTSVPGLRRELKANIWEDTTVRIGMSRTDRVGKAIPEEEFRRWLKVILDLHAPVNNEILRTRYGDLLLAHDFKGRVYLKGLLVSHYGLDGRDYAFGYNFLAGKIGRDRERLTSRRDEALMLTKLWEEAIRIAGEQSNDRGHITDLYIDLFQHAEKAPDISLADQYVSPTLAKTIWLRLKARYNQSFFYSEKEADEQGVTDRYEDIITKDLQQEPFKLAKTLWRILRKYSLARTAYEQKVFNFSTSPPISIPDTPFCATIVRALRSSLKLHQALQGYEVGFVKGGLSTVDVLVDNEEKVLQIHDKWLDFARIHEGAACDFFHAIDGQLKEEEENIFFCDHIIQDLLRLALDELSGPLGLHPSSCSGLRNTAAMKLQRLPRHIQLSAPDSGLGIVVTWAVTHSGLFSEKYGGNFTYHVILHNMSTCALKRSDLLNNIGCPENMAEPEMTCQCPTQRICGRKLEAVFSDLNPAEHYFAMVSRAENMAFFGVPPVAISPAEAATITPEAYTPTSEPANANTFVAEAEVDSDDEMDMSTPRCDDLPEDNIDAQNTVATLRTPVSALAPAQSSATLPTRHRECIIIADEIVRRRLRHHDEADWHEWHTEKLPRLFSQLIPGHLWRDAVGSPCYAYEFANPETDPGYAFRKNEYAHISTVDGDYVVLVRDIWQADDNDGEDDYLVVTKYSFLRSTYPFCAGNREAHTRIHQNELILHFGNFNSMGTGPDAQIIPISNISRAHELPDNAAVDYIVETPEDVDAGPFFCRFAISTKRTMGAACLTPVSTDLLGYQQRWPRPRYSDAIEPVVLDGSPNVLGTSEGFSQAGFKVLAALGFDKDHHSTWKVRYPSAELYDGSLAQIRADVNSAKLPELTHPMPSKAVVGIVAGGTKCFRRNGENTQMPSLNEFLRPLRDIQSHPRFNMDYLALLMPPAVLHSKAVGTFSTSILDLLEKRKSVHIGLTLSRDNGLPLDGSTLVIVASPLCSALPWDAWPKVDDIRPVTVGEVIADLQSPNPRAMPGSSVGFSCLLPDTEGCDDASPRRVWNHNTTQRPTTAEDAVVVDATQGLSVFNGPKNWVHPVRQDLLSIRELARIIGFPDDFVFYGPDDLAYDSLCKAVPPVLAKNVAKVILRAIAGSSPATANGPGSARGQKRARVDVDNQTG